MLRRFINELPKSLDETYERILKGIPEEIRSHSQRLLQCLAVAFRPLRVGELAEILAFEFDVTEGELPTFNADWRSGDEEQEVLSACSSLITIVGPSYERVVQFSHFSVKEYLISDRLATSSEDISSYHILPDAAHKTLAQASLTVLLRLDSHYNEWSAKRFPLAAYAAEYWDMHVKDGGILSHVLGAMKTLFDPDRPHLANLLRVYDKDYVHYRYNAKPLYYSVLYGFYDLVEYLVMKHSQDVNAIGGRLGYPLVAALCGGDIQVAEFLCQHGANVEAQGSGGRTTLHAVIEWSDNVAVGVVQFLLEHGAAVNVRRIDHSTPLHLAAAEGNFEVAQMLLERGADVDSRNLFDETPLHHVLISTESEGRSKLAQLLLKHGAEVNSRDKDHQNPLHLASSAPYSLERVRVLLDHGANVNSKDKYGQTPLHVAILDSKNFSGDDRLGIVQLLVERAADVNAQDENYITPLHLASHKKDLKSVQFLLDNGADVRAVNKQGRTPFHLVFEYPYYWYNSKKHFGVAQLLVEHGTYVNTRDKDHETPLHVAAYTLDLESVQFLLDNGADVHAEGGQGQTPFHRVFESPYYSESSNVAKLLVKHGANVNSRKKDCETPLHLASCKGRLESVRFLLDYGEDVDAKNSGGQTPFHQMIKLESEPWNKKGFIDVAQLLVKHGADVNTPDNDHETPLH